MEGHVKFAYVCACALLSLINLRRSRQPYTVLLAAAMLLTVLADYFIIEAGEYIVGVAVFIAVQALYALRYWRKPRTVVIALGLAVVPAGLLYAAANRQGIIFLAAMYAQLLVFATLGAAAACRLGWPKRLNARLALAGMAAFLLCDIHMAAVNAAAYGLGHMSDGAKRALYVIIWIFYAPSQLLLALSGRDFKKREHEVDYGSQADTKTTDARGDSGVLPDPGGHEGREGGA